MNYLAHLYLTRNQSEKVMIGNFMADAVKGKRSVAKYDKEIQFGIRIHREIDEFTDRHPTFRQGTKRLHPHYGKFSGIILDICYDHILASNWERYAAIELPLFAQNHYELIEKNWDLLPGRTKRWFYYMKKHNLLVNYAKESTIAYVLQGMDHRTSLISGMSNAIREIRQHKEAFTEEFSSFFIEIQDHIHSHLQSAE